MDPKCSCGKNIDSKRDINIEEIDGGIGDKGYKIAIVYCQHCQKVLGAFPSRNMWKDMMRDILKEEVKKLNKK